MVLQPLLQGQVADREQEIVVVVVVRAVELVGLLHEGAVLLDLVGGGV